MDHQGLPPVDLFVAADPDVAARAMLAVLRPDDARSEHQPALRAPAAATSEAARGAAVGAPADGLISVTQMGRMLRHVVGERPVSLLHLPLSWDSTIWPFRHPLDFIGSDGGGGVGGGPGIAVGAALALRGSGRLAIAICGDGDFLMGVTALWTAAHYHVPLLIVVANNRSFFNDEVHQERMARMRGRPVENKWIGQRISDPDIDMAQLARAQGAQGFGPVTEAAAMGEAFQQAIAVVEGGGVAVVDVRVTPGYTPAMASALAPGTNRT